MADPLELFGPHKKPEKAAVAGFRQVLKNSDVSDFQEFAFWVITKVEEGQVVFYHTKPITDGSPDGVSLKMPIGHIVRSHCHTHPKSMMTQHFSPGDKKLFQDLNKVKPIPLFLMTPLKQLRFAVTEKDFMVGQPLDWPEE